MAEPDTVAGADASTTAQPEPRDKGTFVPLIFGGAVATALGFFGGQLDSVEQALGWGDGPDMAVQEMIAAQEEKIAAQSAKIDELVSQLGALPEPAPAVDLSSIESQITSQSETLTGVQDVLTDVTARLETVEKRPMTDSLSEEAKAAYQAELDRLQAAALTQRTEIESLLGDAQGSLAATLAASQNEIGTLRSDVESELASTVAASQEKLAALQQQVEGLLAEAAATKSAAEDQANVALARAAMAKIIAAVDTGEPYAGALAELQAVQPDNVPEPLVAPAADGVPTLDVVQSGISEAAAAALAAVRREQAASGEGGIGSFLQRQLGARSVERRDGDDPDAVLSRVEDAVIRGQLGEALTETDALPQTALDAMSDWISLAQTRHAAVTAADELLTALSTN